MGRVVASESFGGWNGLFTTFPEEILVVDKSDGAFSDTYWIFKQVFWQPLTELDEDGGYATPPKQYVLIAISTKSGSPLGGAAYRVDPTFLAKHIAIRLESEHAAGIEWASDAVEFMMTGRGTQEMRNAFWELFLDLLPFRDFYLTLKEGRDFTGWTYLNLVLDVSIFLPLLRAPSIVRAIELRLITASLRQANKRVLQSIGRSVANGSYRGTELELLAALQEAGTGLPRNNIVNKIVDTLSLYGDDLTAGLRLVDDAEFKDLLSFPKYQGEISTNTRAFYDPDSATIFIRRDQGEDVLRLLVHEGQHMLDFRSGGIFAGKSWKKLDPVEKFLCEWRAYRAQLSLGKEHFPFEDWAELVLHILREYKGTRIHPFISNLIKR